MEIEFLGYEITNSLKALFLSFFLHFFNLYYSFLILLTTLPHFSLVYFSTAYILLKSNLTQMLKAENKNISWLHNDYAGRRKKFWKNVPTKYIKELLRIYLIDLTLLGYDVDV